MLNKIFPNIRRKKSSAFVKKSSAFVNVQHYSLTTRIRSPERLLDNAEILAPYVKVHPTVRRHLFQNRSHKGAKFEEWNADFSLALARDSIMRDWMRIIKFDGFGDLIDVPQSREIYQTLEEKRSASGTGILFCPFHGGYVVLVRMFIDWCAKDIDVVRGVGAHNVATNANFVLFKALRNLQDGTDVYIAPDGFFGKLTHTIDVFSVSRKIGLGAAFLAYKTKSAVVFLRFKFDGTTFVPYIEFGPHPLAGQSLNEYNQVFLEAYQSFIIDFFGDDPRNLALAPGWAKEIVQYTKENPSD